MTLFVCCESILAQQFQYVPSALPAQAVWTNGVALADVDQDGDLDVLFANGSTYSSGGSQPQHLFLNNGAGTFVAAHANLNVANFNAQMVIAEDVDADGDKDLIYAAEGPYPAPTQLPRMLINNGTGTFSDQSATRLPAIPMASFCVCAGDVDDDGDADLVFTDGATFNGTVSQCRLYLNNGSGFFSDATATRLPADLYNAQDACLVDWDGDFDIDIVLTGKGGTGKRSRLYLNNGSGVFSIDNSLNAVGSANTYEGDAADLDGDGDMDIAMQSISGFLEGWVRNNGPGGVTPITFSGTNGDDDNEMASLDYDNDGDFDVFVACLGQTEKCYRQESGIFTRENSVIQAQNDSSLDIGFGDLDGDDDYDMVTAQGESGNFTDKVYRNNGAPDTRAPIFTRIESPAGFGPGNTEFHVQIRDAIADDGACPVAVTYIYSTLGVTGAASGAGTAAHQGGGLFRALVPTPPGTTSAAVAWKAIDPAGNAAMANAGLGETIVPCITPSLIGVPQASVKYLFHQTPVRWQGDVVAWSGDTSPRNKIDDKIDSSADPLFDVIINFNRCVEAEDLNFLTSIGHGTAVQRVYRYITSVAMTGLTKADVVAVSNLSSVAFLERQFKVRGILATSVPAIGVSPGFYSPLTVDEQFGFDGTGVNIVILDTGVDNTTHAAFASTPFIGGFNAINSTFVDPDDDQGHGTLCASIALAGSFGSIPRGVASGAGLIDVKVLDDQGEGSTTRIMDALEVIYDKREDWKPAVISMSFAPDVGTSGGFDGTDSLSQLVDLGDSMGIVMVAAAGNEGPGNVGLGTPAAATRAITVASSNTNGTQNRANDTIASFSSRGPRASDGDQDCRDELKPEVSAPGVNITGAAHNTASGTLTASGTSLAGPHVAGVAALIKQASPAMNPGAIKDLIVRTCEPLGGASKPSCDPVWNAASGFGLMDAYDALDQIAIGQDVGFPSHPPAVSWESPDIRAEPSHPKKNKSQTIFANVRNHGTLPATNVRVDFGIQVLSGATSNFFDVGSKIINIPAQSTVEVSSTWTTQTKLKNHHYCVKVSISYGLDPDFANNLAQRNYGKEGSPVTFWVQNTQTLAPAQIDLDIACDEGDIAGWTVSAEPKSVNLSALDCPKPISVFAIPPFGAPDGAGVHVKVAARIGSTLLGGVTIEAQMDDCNGNGIDDYMDIIHGVSLDLNDDGIPDECPSPCGFDPYGDTVLPKNDLHLLGLGKPAIGTLIELVTANATANAPAILICSLAPQAIPIQGGVLYVDPSTMLLSIAMLTNSDGVARVPIVIPNIPAISGAEAYFQTLSPGPSGGIEHFSNGLRLKICGP